MTVGAQTITSAVGGLQSLSASADVQGLTEPDEVASCV